MPALPGPGGMHGMPEPRGGASRFGARRDETRRTSVTAASRAAAEPRSCAPAPWPARAGRCHAAAAPRAGRVLVMSATLGGGLGERAAALLRRAAADAPLLVSEGRAFPVHTVYLAAPGAGVQPYTLSDPNAWGAPPRVSWQRARAFCWSGGRAGAAAGSGACTSTHECSASASELLALKENRFESKFCDQVARAASWSARRPPRRCARWPRHPAAALCSASCPAAARRGPPALRCWDQ